MNLWIVHFSFLQSQGYNWNYFCSWNSVIWKPCDRILRSLLLLHFQRLWATSCRSVTQSHSPPSTLPRGGASSYSSKRLFSAVVRGPPCFGCACRFQLIPGWAWSRYLFLRFRVNIFGLRRYILTPYLVIW